MSVGEVRVNTRRIADLVKWEVRREYCRDGVKVTNGTGAAVTIDDPMGYPMVVTAGVANFALAATQANVNALLIYDKKIDNLADGADLERGFLVPVEARGPNLINENMIPAKDAAGGDFTLATIKTALEALGFKFVKEPAKTEVQTT